MLTKNDCVPFVAYCVQEIGLDHSQIREIVQDVESELHRYDIPEYTPILAFEKTVVLDGKLVAVPICRWFFIAMLNWFLKKGIPIPENVAVYIRPVLTPMVISKLRKFQKYGFLITEQRIDEAACFAIEIAFGTVDENRFLIPENFKYDAESGTVLINGIKATCSINAIEKLETAKLAGSWVSITKSADEKLPRIRGFVLQNIFRSALSIACKNYVQNAIGRSIQGHDDKSYTFEITSLENALENLVSRVQVKRPEFPLGDFLHDENASIFYRATIYAESLHCSHDEKFIAASEFCGKRIPEVLYYRLLKKARKVAEKYYQATIAKME